MENVRVVSFSTDNKEQYKRIEKYSIHSFKGSLPSYCMSYYEKIYTLMVKPIFFREYMAGRCIIADTTQIDDEETLYMLAKLNSIPISVIKKYPILIEDLYIRYDKRNMGYGKLLIDFVLNEIKSRNLSLHSQENAKSFWKKLGFTHFKDNVFICDRKSD